MESDMRPATNDLTHLAHVANKTSEPQAVYKRIVNQRSRIMENRITEIDNHADRHDQRGGGPQRIDAILADFLAQYQARFPEARIAVVQTPAVAA